MLTLQSANKFSFSTNVFGKLDLSLKYFSLVFGGDRGKYQVSSLQNSSSLFRHFFFVFFLNIFFSVIPHLHGKCKDRYSTWVEFITFYFDAKIERFFISHGLFYLIFFCICVTIRISNRMFVNCLVPEMFCISLFTLTWNILCGEIRFQPARTYIDS